MSDPAIGDCIIAGIASGDTVLEQMSEIVTHLERAGFVIVPREPTEEMKLAFYRSADDCAVCLGDGFIPDERPILVLCEACQSEGRILTNNGGPYDTDNGECPTCKGRGDILIKCETITMEDLDVI